MGTYLDHAASTPMRAEAIEAMTPYLDAMYANPSGSHRFAVALPYARQRSITQCCIALNM